MRISIILESFQPNYWGGKETRWNKLIPEMSRNHDLTIFADFSRTNPKLAFPDSNFRAINIGPLPYMYNLNGNRSLPHAFVFTLKCFKLFSVKADLIITDLTPLISLPLIRIIAFFLRSNFSVVWHEVWDLKTWCRYSKFAGHIGLLLQTIAYIASENIVVPSRKVEEDFRKRYSSKSPTLIQNGVDMLTPPIFGSIIDFVDNDSINLLYVGRLIKHKNCDFLLHLLATAIDSGKKWNLRIVGNGPLLQDLTNLVSELEIGHCVQFFQDIPTVDLHALYRNSDVFVFASEREGYGFTVAESLMFNLPVVIYDVYFNASTQFVTSEDFGQKIPKLDIGLWIDGVAQVLTRERTHISRDFRATQLSWTDVSEIYERFLASTLKATH
jgi:glycosyltransferase involved in cell wall biosynthesis